jgi:hypothetical protein
MKNTVIAAILLLAASPIWAECVTNGGANKPEFQACLALAKLGDAEAQTQVGNAYIKGKVVDKNYQAALDWYEKAAELGNANAMYNIGVIHDDGLGVKMNYDEAAIWYRKSADAGFPYAQYNLGVMYEYGQSVPLDLIKAREYYLKAAEQGEPSAQFALGLLYDKGLGVPTDYVIAYMWWHITGSGHPHATFNRDSLVEDMTPEQISKAKDMAQAWQTRHARLKQLPAQVFAPGFE